MSETTRREFFRKVSALTVGAIVAPLASRIPAFSAEYKAVEYGHGFTTTSEFSKVLWPGIKKLWDQEYKKHGDES